MQIFWCSLLLCCLGLTIVVCCLSYVVFFCLILSTVVTCCRFCLLSVVCCCHVHSFIQAISIAPFQVHYYSEALLSCIVFPVFCVLHAICHCLSCIG